MTPAGEVASASDEPAGPAPALPLSWRAVILVVAVAQFLVGHGAVWEHMFDWDAAILYSYASVPVLVLVALLLRRRLAFVPWLIHTLEVASVKFAVTATFLVVLLVSRHDPSKLPTQRPAEPSPVAEPTRAARPVRTPTIIAPETTGALRGTVKTAAGVPVEGALVYVASGLGDHVFAAPETTFTIENDGQKISPALDAVVLGQPVVARSRNGELHTLWLRPLDDVNAKMNVSVLGSGAPAHITFPDRFEGLATIECAVHRAREGKAFVGLFRHPFFTRTDAAGRFELRGVPAGALGVGAFTIREGRVAQQVQLAAQGAVTLALVLAP